MSQTTRWIAENGVWAVIALMALDSVLPIGGELVMLYAGVLASGAVGVDATSALHLGHGLASYLALAAAGVLGSVIGGTLAWAVGSRGRPMLLAYAPGRVRWLLPDASEVARTEAWLARFGGVGVLVGRLTPVVRSFVSMGAGLAGVSLRDFGLCNLAAAAVWCFGIGALGLAVGHGWRGVEHSFHYADYAALVLALICVTLATLHRVRARGPRAR